MVEMMLLQKMIMALDGERVIRMGMLLSMSMLFEKGKETPLITLRARHLDPPLMAS